MKKNILASAIIALSLSTTAFAQEATVANELNLDARFDHVSYHSKDVTTAPNFAPNQPMYDAFQISRLKLDYEGRFDKYSFRTRVDLNKNNQTPTAKDKASTFVDFGYLVTKLMDGLNLTVGKFYNGMGGIEGSTNGGDLYSTSAAYNEVVTKFYATGAQVDYTYDNHKIRVSMVNNTEDVSASSKLSQTRSLMGAVYNGKFFDGLVNFTLGNFNEKYVFNGVTKTNNYFDAGAKISHEMFDVELDYLKNTYKFDPQVLKNILDTQSNVVLARYKFSPEVSAFVKYEASEQKIANDASSSHKAHINAYTIAFEQKLFPAQNLRWHAAFVQKETKEDNYGSNQFDKQTENYAYVGMRILTDILK